MRIPYLSRMPDPAVIGTAVVFGALTLTPLPAISSIQVHSVTQFAGNAVFSNGDIDFVTLGAPPPGFDASVRITPAGNTLSWAGYNVPNPAGPMPPVYQAGFNNIAAGMPPVGDFISLPAVVIGGPEVGPAVPSSRFVLDNWVVSTFTFQGVDFLTGVGRGTIYAEGGHTLPGVFALSSPFFDITPGVVNAFSAELKAIPVPGAIWLFGSGLVALAAIRRRF